MKKVLKFTKAIDESVNQLQQEYVTDSDINREALSRLKGLSFYCSWLDNEPVSLLSADNSTVVEVIGSSRPSAFSKVFDHNKKSKHSRTILPKNSTCCFNHMIGMPQKQGKTFPLFDYERKLFDTLNTTKLVYCLKATGLGITEFCIRYIAWLCLKDDKLRGSQIVIVTGPRLEKSVEIITRMKQLFIHSDIVKTFNTKNTVIILNGVYIQAYPSDHLDDARGIPNVSFIYVDEADFFRPGEQLNLRDVIERYLIKSNPWIILTSTPNRPDSIMAQIMAEKDSIYERLYFDYTVGIGKMWPLKEIQRQMKSPSFEREYNLKFLGQVGNVFATASIDALIEEYPLNEINTTSRYYPRWCGIDPGYSSSMFGICIVQWKDDRLEVVYTASLNKPLYTDTLQIIRQLVQKYHLCKIFIDGSAAHLIHELKHGYDEYVTYERLEDKILDNYIRTGCREPLIVPVAFQKYHKDLLKHAMKAVAKQRVKIHPKFENLITSLRSATTKAEYDLDKVNTAWNDLFDAFRLSLLCLKVQGE